jgi:NhaC family Na+:H+ antiporter
VLSRTISASATPTSALIPWNSCGAFMAATLGVSSFSYLPYAVFNIASPLIAVAMVFAGWRTWRVKANPLSKTASDL